MAYNNDTLNDIYDKTGGYCHICNKKISFRNYGIHNTRGAWQVDHSIPKAKGGSNHLNNLYPACIPCNLMKGAASNRTIRKYISAAKVKARPKKQDTIPLGAVGAVLGLPFGPAGIVIGTSIGLLLDKK